MVEQVTMPADLPDTQEEEYALAKQEGRQPRCVMCGEPLDTIVQTQYCDLTWTWDDEAKCFRKHDSGDAEKPSCGNCGNHNRALLDETHYTFF